VKSGLFGWFYRHLARGILSNVSPEDLKPLVQGFLSDPEVQKGLMSFSDVFYDRYRTKFFGALGGLQKGVNAMVESENPYLDILDSKGQVSLKKIIPILASNLTKPNKPPESRLP